MVASKEWDWEQEKGDHSKQSNKHDYIEASLNRSKKELDYSYIIGSKVSVTIDRPLGTTHP